MAETKAFFLTVAQRVFSNWTALKMAVEHGMGTKESAVDFCPYITEVMYMNERLSSSEIADELENYMDEQFNTELQDDSALQVAEVLLRFYNYCIQKNEAQAVEELNRLPPLQPWITSNEPVRRACNTAAPDNDSSSESEEETNDTMEVAEDDWTEVRTRRKR